MCVVTYAPRADAPAITEWKSIHIDPRSFDENRLLCVWHAILEAKRLNAQRITPDQYFADLDAQRVQTSTLLHAIKETIADIERENSLKFLNLEINETSYGILATSTKYRPLTVLQTALQARGFNAEMFVAPDCLRITLAQ